MDRANVSGYHGLPRWIYAIAAAGGLFVLLPLAAMAAKVNWPQFIPLVTSESSLTALALSLRTSAASTVLCIVFGVPLALVLARSSFRGQRLLRAFVLLPLVLPPVVGGIALLYTFGRQGLLGRSLEAAGIQIAFSTTAVVLAQTFVALPFLVVSLEGALRTAGGRYEAVAATLGARPTTVLRRVTVPLVLPGLASGAVLSFARSLGEFGATLTFAGSLQGDPDAAAGNLPAAGNGCRCRRRAFPRPGGCRRDSGGTDLPAPGAAEPTQFAGGQHRQPAGRRATGRWKTGRCPVSFHMQATVRARGFDVGLSLAPGETVAVLGPNGAGKSTLLNVIAGLLRPDTGRAEIDGKVLFDLDGGATAWTAPHHRGTALLAQEPLLFPHLSALENVAFGPRSAGTGRKAARESARKWLADVDAAELEARRPAELSGGQAQRVAVARALAANPRSTAAGRAHGRPGHPRRPAAPQAAEEGPGRAPRHHHHPRRP